MRCVVHGSFRKHYAEIKQACASFRAAGIDVLAPKDSDIESSEDGFIFLQDENGQDPRYIELLYLRHLKHLGRDGFSYFVNPEGYIGKSTSYELGIAQTTNVPCFFLEMPKDHPAYVPRIAIWKPEDLAFFIHEHDRLPLPFIEKNELRIHQLWESLMVPGSVVATGAIIEFDPDAPAHETEILLVKTHKWGGRYSMVGGRVRRHERLDEALKREVREEAGLSAKIGEHLCTFDQIKNSGYYRAGVQHIFVDHVVQVNSKNVQLNEEAQEYIWMPARQALRDLDIEPNARHTLELYVKLN